MKRRILTVLAAAGAFALVAGPALAQVETELTETEQLGATLTVVFVAIAAAMVFLMQAGFTLVEAGLTRAKNSANIVMKNLADMSIGAVAYWAFGAAFAYGTGTFLGMNGFFDPISVMNTVEATIDGSPVMVDGGTQWVFQMVFAATAATIVSGAVAERMKFAGYVIMSIAMTSIIYPIVTHWQWTFSADAGSWLYAMGYHDFAGSSLVHMTGGVAALMGAAILGPRIGKYDKDGKPRAIPGHNISYAIVGVFILWFGWFGFNAGSQLAASGLADASAISTILVSTNLAAGAGGVVAMAVTWIRNGKPDVGMTGNGVLAGLVGITAGTNFATGFQAIVIGAVCGGVVVFAVTFFDKIKIDDPVGAISVHGVCGAIGTLAVAWVGAGQTNGDVEISFATQLIGVLAIAAFVAASSGGLFLILKKTMGIRVSEQEEMEGLDVHEHGSPGYAPDVMASSSGRFGGSAAGFGPAPRVPTAPHPVQK